MSDVKNINTLAIEVERSFREAMDIMCTLEIDSSVDYRRGFRDGVKALQMRFLRAMEKGELDYARTNPDTKEEMR